MKNDKSKITTFLKRQSINQTKQILPRTNPIQKPHTDYPIQERSKSIKKQNIIQINIQTQSFTKLQNEPSIMKYIPSKSDLKSQRQLWKLSESKRMKKMNTQQELGSSSINKLSSDILEDYNERLQQENKKLFMQNSNLIIENEALKKLQHSRYSNNNEVQDLKKYYNTKIKQKENLIQKYQQKFDQLQAKLEQYQVQTKANIILTNYYKELCQFFGVQQLSIQQLKANIFGIFQQNQKYLQQLKMTQQIYRNKEYKLNEQLQQILNRYNEMVFKKNEMEIQIVDLNQCNKSLIVTIDNLKLNNQQLVQQLEIIKKCLIKLREQHQFIKKNNNQTIKNAENQIKKLKSENEQLKIHNSFQAQKLNKQQLQLLNSKKNDRVEDQLVQMKQNYQKLQNEYNNLMIEKENYVRLIENLKQNNMNIQTEYYKKLEGQKWQYSNNISELRIRYQELNQKNVNQLKKNHEQLLEKYKKQIQDLNYLNNNKQIDIQLLQNQKNQLNFKLLTYQNQINQFTNKLQYNQRAINQIIKNGQTEIHSKLFMQQQLKNLQLQNFELRSNINLLQNDLNRKNEQQQYMKNIIKDRQNQLNMLKNKNHYEYQQMTRQKQLIINDLNKKIRELIERNEQKQSDYVMKILQFQTQYNQQKNRHQISVNQYCQKLQYKNQQYSKLSVEYQKILKGNGQLQNQYNDLVNQLYKIGNEKEVKMNELEQQIWNLKQQVKLKNLLAAEELNNNKMILNEQKSKLHYENIELQRKCKSYQNKLNQFIYNYNDLQVNLQNVTKSNQNNKIQYQKIIKQLEVSNKIKYQYQQNIQNLKIQLINLQNIYKNQQIEYTRKQLLYKSQIEQMQSKYNLQLQSSKNQLLKLTNKYEQKIKELINSHQNDIKNINENLYTISNKYKLKQMDVFELQARHKLELNQKFKQYQENRINLQNKIEKYHETFIQLKKQLNNQIEYYQNNQITLRQQLTLSNHRYNVEFDRFQKQKNIYLSKYENILKQRETIDKLQQQKRQKFLSQKDKYYQNQIKRLQQKELQNFRQYGQKIQNITKFYENLNNEYKLKYEQNRKYKQLKQNEMKQLIEKAQLSKSEQINYIKEVNSQLQQKLYEYEYIISNLEEKCNYFQVNYETLQKQNQQAIIQYKNQIENLNSKIILQQNKKKQQNEIINKNNIQLSEMLKIASENNNKYQLQLNQLRTKLDSEAQSCLMAKQKNQQYQFQILVFKQKIEQIRSSYENQVSQLNNLVKQYQVKIQNLLNQILNIRRQTDNNESSKLKQYEETINTQKSQIENLKKQLQKVKSQNLLKQNNQKSIKSIKQINYSLEKQKIQLLSNIDLMKIKIQQLQLSNQILKQQKENKLLLNRANTPFKTQNKQSLISTSQIKSIQGNQDKIIQHKPIQFKYKLLQSKPNIVSYSHNIAINQIKSPNQPETHTKIYNKTNNFYVKTNPQIYNSNILSIKSTQFKTDTSPNQKSIIINYKTDTQNKYNHQNQLLTKASKQSKFRSLEQIQNQHTSNIKFQHTNINITPKIYVNENKVYSSPKNEIQSNSNYYFKSDATFGNRNTHSTQIQPQKPGFLNKFKYSLKSTQMQNKPNIRNQLVQQSEYYKTSEKNEEQCC